MHTFSLVQDDVKCEQSNGGRRLEGQLESHFVPSPIADIVLEKAGSYVDRLHEDEHAQLGILDRQRASAVAE